MTDSFGTLCTLCSKKVVHQTHGDNLRQHTEGVAGYMAFVGNLVLFPVVKKIR